MENTTSLNMDDVKEKVLAQIISMPILCWETNTTGYIANQ